MKEDSKKNKVWIAAGTTEGRILAEYCRENRIPAVASVVSSYGEQLIEEGESLTVHTGAMDAEQMERFIQEERIDLVMDATHPYAQEASRNIRQAAKNRQVEYLRCLRGQEEAEPFCDKGEGGISADSFKGVGVFYVASVEEAVRMLEGTEGNVFLTTGSKELAAFSALSGFLERAYARVLPGRESLELCLQAGLSGKHIICMQGPFSRDLNMAMLKSVQARWMVTKEAGKAGGFAEKMEAARELGISVIVIGRPKEESGLSIAACKARLKERICVPDICRVALIGAGMGTVDGMTGEARKRVAQSQVVFGAKRLLNSFSSLCEGKMTVPAYRTDVIVQWLKEHPDVTDAVVLYSGDVGFYSGAAGFFALKEDGAERKDTEACEVAHEQTMQQKGKKQGGRSLQVDVIPGISSLVYFCAKCRVSWETVRAVSFHGRENDLEELIKSGKTCFLLLDRQHTPDVICRKLCEMGSGDRFVSAGENLSYPHERILSKKAKEMAEERFEGLSVMLLYGK
ncbi:MAG: precorrin-6A reductase [bacterium]|nr:precorrin-6A reductase [bacterium]